MSHENLLKEIYEKPRKKMATDGQNEMNDNDQKVPPFMKGRAKPNSPDPKKNARKSAIQARLASMSKKGK